MLKKYYFDAVDKNHYCSVVFKRIVFLRQKNVKKDYYDTVYTHN